MSVGMTRWDQAQLAVLRALIGCLRALGPVRASNWGGALARTIGPALPVSAVALSNLRLAMPELDAAIRKTVLRGVWDNLGRTIAELGQLDRLRETTAGPGWELTGARDLIRTEANRPVICFAGHLANWEVLPLIAASAGVRFGIFYRAASSPAVDHLIRDLRAAGGGPDFSQFAKGSVGARLGLRHLSRGGALGIMVDQKLNDGLAVPFFGHPAMTAPALAALALRFRCAVVPAQVQRLGPARLRVILHPKLTLPDTGDLQADIYSLTATVNQCLESWIRERPAEWLWLHRRWPRAPKPGKPTAPAAFTPQQPEGHPDADQ